MKYHVKKSDGASFEVTLDEIQDGLESGKINPDWLVKGVTEGETAWKKIGHFCGVATTPPFGLSSVRVNSRTIRFPERCPHCFGKTGGTVAIESARRRVARTFTGHLWQSHTVQVPFCDQIVRKVRATENTIAVCMGTSLIAFFVILAAGYFPQWSGFQKMFVFIGVAVVLGILSDLCRPTQFVCILFANEAGTEFGFQNPDYAQLFAEMNETVVKRAES